MTKKLLSHKDLQKAMKDPLIKAIVESRIIEVKNSKVMRQMEFSIKTGGFKLEKKC
jgi:hypothetical protein